MQESIMFSAFVAVLSAMFVAFITNGNEFLVGLTFFGVLLLTFILTARR